MFIIERFRETGDGIVGFCLIIKGLEYYYPKFFISNATSLAARLLGWVLVC